MTKERLRGAPERGHALETKLTMLVVGRSTFIRIKLTDELRRLDESKWADRFSRRLAWRAYPESLRDIGVLGMGGKTVETGETFGEGGEWCDLTVVAVDGLSFPRLKALDCRKALKMSCLEFDGPRIVPNDVEFNPT